MMQPNELVDANRFVSGPRWRSSAFRSPVVALAPVLFEDPMLVGIGAVVGGAVLIVLWWLLFSRAPWLERIGALVLMIPLALVTKRVADISIAGAGQGFLVYIMTVPLLAFGLVLWAASTRRLNTAARRAALVAILVHRVRADSADTHGRRWRPQSIPLALDAHC